MHAQMYAQPRSYLWNSVIWMQLLCDSALRNRLTSALNLTLLREAVCSILPVSDHINQFSTITELLKTPPANAISSIVCENVSFRPKAFAVAYYICTAVLTVFYTDPTS